MKIYAFLLVMVLIAAFASAQSVKVSSDEKTNSLIIKAPTAMQKQIEQIVKDLDKQNNEMTEIKVVQLVYLNASEVEPVLQIVMNAFKPLPIKSSQLELNNNSWNNSIHGIVLADERTNKILLISDKVTVINLEKVAKELDKKTITANSAIITKLKNANASNVSEILNSISRR